ncbi:dipeptidase PepE [Robbsia sp. Bb-Pol-6]|uniref:Dipeptidase PepE n=1 Tax=Robbsia betulipollinis TaxID=2981849 RepID=A0ABT3ZT81_9BURK|nr:dipeptidase PepE [Robbsia betulipollinis]MCY0389462.1 dipeptidase PepE [Robbsia betulipollinis]
MNLLLLSNSRGPDGRYLAHALTAIATLAGPRRRALFLPFAGVTMSWLSYTETVAEALAPLGIDVRSLDDAGDIDAQHAALHDAELIVVGGGNTFQLLKICRERGLLDVIAHAVRGGTPYLGWSAGANLACPTISTTNDMPIVDPRGLTALGLIDFQINPHYTNALPAGHRGETRDQRIAEFLVANPDRTVLGLPEGDGLQVTNDTVRLCGPFPARHFVAGGAAGDVPPGTVFDLAGRPRAS